MEIRNQTNKPNAYITIQDEYDLVSCRTKAIIDVLDAVSEFRERMDSPPKDESIAIALSQVNENIRLMDTLVNNLVEKLRTSP